MSIYRRGAAVRLGLLGAAGLLAVMSPITAAAAQSRPQANSAPYQLGVDLDLGGPTAVYGTQALKAINGEIAYVNAHGGIDGRKIMVDALSDNSILTQATTNIVQLATSDHVLAITGLDSSAICQGIAPLAQQYQVPTVCYGAPTSLAVPPQKYLFVASSLAIQESKPTLELAQTILGKTTGIKVAIFATTAIANQQWAAKVASELQNRGDDVVYNQAVPLTASSEATQATAIASSGAEVILYGANVPLLQGFYQTLKSDGAGNIPIVGISQEVAYPFNAATNDPNYYVTDPFVVVNPASSRPAVKAFVAAMATQGLSGISALNATNSFNVGYMQAAAIVSALKMCGLNCTTSKVDADLQKVKLALPGVAAKFSFTPTRHYAVSSYDAYRWQNGTFVQVQSKGHLVSFASDSV